MYGVIIVVSIMTTGCVGDSNENKESTKTEDTLNVNVTDSKGQETAVTAEVSCSIFFETDDREDEETGEIYKGSVNEREDFRKTSSYTYCYDVERFHSLILNGSGDGLSLFVNENNKTIFKKENIKLSNKMTFTHKDFNFTEGRTFTILLKQGDKVLFNGKIDSQGCM